MNYNKSMDILLCRLTDEGWIKTRIIRLEFFSRLSIEYYDIDDLIGSILKFYNLFNSFFTIYYGIEDTLKLFHA